MLISFSVENWMSFRKPVSFTMVAGRERQHKERVPKVDKYPVSILPAAAIYGGNASGKTNFFKALSFAKKLIVKGTQPDSLIPVNPYCLDATGEAQPVRFAFELLIDEIIYEFSFSLTRHAILREKLVKITSASEKVLYERSADTITFDGSLKKDRFLQFAFQGTRDNQLFLTNSVSQKVDKFRAIYNWFNNNLILIAPDSRFQPFEQFLDESNPLYNVMNEMLQKLDTGISRLGGEEIPFDNIPFPEPLKIKLQEEVKEGATVRIATEPAKQRFVITRKYGELKAKKLIAFHRKEDGTEAKFDIMQESDGSQRIIDLLPALLEMSVAASKKIFVIDEIDRSLHTLMTRGLLEAYLSDCSPKSRTQLLFTTHDVQLMDQQLLRRDEMWITERDASGCSGLFSFIEYKDIRADKQIRKSYLQGRLGGIPRILPGPILMSDSFAHENNETI